MPLEPSGPVGHDKPGAMAFSMECDPAFNYVRNTHEAEIAGGGVGFQSPELRLGLSTNVKLNRDRDGVVAEFTIQEGELAVFVLGEMEPGAVCDDPPSEAEVFDMFKSTVADWMQ